MAVFTDKKDAVSGTRHRSFLFERELAYIILPPPPPWPSPLSPHLPLSGGEHVPRPPPSSSSPSLTTVSPLHTWSNPTPPSRHPSSSLSTRRLWQPRRRRAQSARRCLPRSSPRTGHAPPPLLLPSLPPSLKSQTRTVPPTTPTTTRPAPNNPCRNVPRRYRPLSRSVSPLPTGPVAPAPPLCHPTQPTGMPLICNFVLDKCHTNNFAPLSHCCALRRCRRRRRQQ